jgi:hypothetical protein
MDDFFKNGLSFTERAPYSWQIDEELMSAAGGFAIEQV